jgi:hypothetical protein
VATDPTPLLSLIRRSRPRFAAVIASKAKRISLHWRIVASTADATTDSRAAAASGFGAAPVSVSPLLPPPTLFPPPIPLERKPAASSATLAGNLSPPLPPAMLLLSIPTSPPHRLLRAQSCGACSLLALEEEGEGAECNVEFCERPPLVIYHERGEGYC